MNVEPIRPPKFGRRPDRRSLASEQDPLARPSTARKRYQKRCKKIRQKPLSKRLRKLLDL